MAWQQGQGEDFGGTVKEPYRASNDPGMAKPAEPPEAGEQQPSGCLRQPMVTQEHGDVSSYLKTGCLVLLLNCFLPFFFLSKTSNETRTTITITCLHRWLNKCIALAGQVVRKDQEEAERLIDV